MAGIFRKSLEIMVLQKTGWLNWPGIRHPAAAGAID
jgi:hypothetical protein